MFSETVRCYLAGKTGALWRFAVTWPRWDRSRHAFNTQKCQLCSTETGGLTWPRSRAGRRATVYISPRPRSALQPAGSPDSAR